MTSLDHETVARDSIVALTQRVSQQLERDIIETPEDWLWMAE
jgi:lauroyl/myristoyl acyltransferase